MTNNMSNMTHSFELLCKCRKNCHRSADCFFRRILKVRSRRSCSLPLTSPPPTTVAAARQRTVQLERISIPMKREGTVKEGAMYTVHGDCLQEVAGRTYFHMSVTCSLPARHLFRATSGGNHSLTRLVRLEVPQMRCSIMSKAAGGSLR